ncbi:vomeromodulin-like isoform X3 [Panthera pardus]|uniref:Vomeromodulin-like isoform X3 n=1 Tax=Panthera pardus TaxID=9691 RepID=A0A9V1G3A0_PANPR|nr:vomeromodulin-like isoform X3 [Panthera pardus]
MLTLWALVFTLTVQARELDLQNPSLLLRNLPQLALEVTKKAPLDLPPGPLFRSAPKDSPSKKHPTRTPGGRCLPVARYFMSSSKLEEYLNATLPPQIEKMLMCEEIDLAGVLGTVISTLSNSNLLSVLDLTSSLNIPGSDVLGGILGKESGGQSPKLPLSLLSTATDALNIQETLGRLLPTGAEKNPVKGLVNTLDLPNLPQPLNDIVDQAGKLTESTEGVLNSLVPVGVSDAVTGLLRNADLAELLLGLAGPVVSLLGYQVHSDITLKIGISTNNTQCINLQVQDKDIKFKKVTLQVVETVTNTLPVPLPLDQIVSQVLTVAMKEKLQEVESCDIDLSDFSKCKNSTDLFKYNVKSSRTSAQGLSVFYCAKAFFNKYIVPVPGSPLPPDPRNANISLTLSHKLLTVIITLSVKQSSTKMNNLAASITKIAYFFKSGNQLQVTLWITVEKDGENFTTVERTSIISHDSKISKDKLIPDFKIMSSEDKVTPSEAEAEVQDILLEVLKKFLSALNELTSAWNVPPGLTSNPLTNAKVKVLKLNDLQAAN